MIIASCPSCREDVTIPADALPDSIVQCPLCREELRLRDFLSQLPPSLIVIDPIATDRSAMDLGVIDRDEGLVAENSEVSGLSSPLINPRSPDVDITSDDSPSFERSTVDDSIGIQPTAPADFDFAPSPGGQAAEKAQISPGEPIESRKSGPRKKNHVLEFAKIAAGGLLALPLAQIILWWLPGEWRRDPFQLAPAVAEVLPWVVPSNYHPLPAAAEQRFDSDWTVDVPGYSIKEDLPIREDWGRSTSRPSPPRSDPARSDPARSDPARSDPADSSPATLVAESVLLGIKEAPTYSADELRAAFEAALQASAAWDTSTDQSKQALDNLGGQLFLKFAQLGETITFVQPGQPGVRELVGSLDVFLRSFVREPGKLAMIGNRAGDWLQREDRPNNGVLLFGTVKQIKLRGQLFETELELAAQKRQTVAIISKVDPKPIYSARSRILMLGVIVDDPQANLAGYEGDLPMIVMGAFPVPISP